MKDWLDDYEDYAKEDPDYTWEDREADEKFNDEMNEKMEEEYNRKKLYKFLLKILNIFHIN